MFPIMAATLTHYLPKAVPFPFNSYPDFTVSFPASPSMQFQILNKIISFNHQGLIEMGAGGI